MKLNVLLSSSPLYSSSSLGSLMIICRYAVDRSFSQIYFSLFLFYEGKKNIEIVVCCVHLLNVGLLKRLKERLRHIRLLLLLLCSVHFYQIDRNTKYTNQTTNTHTCIPTKRTHENGENHDNKKMKKNMRMKTERKSKTFQRIVYEECQNEEIFCFISLSLSLIHSFILVLFRSCAV